MALDKDKKQVIASSALLIAETLLESEFDETNALLYNEFSVPFITSLLTSCDKPRMFKRDIQDYTPEEFRLQYRISKHTFNLLCQKLSRCPQIMPSNSKGGRPAVPLEKQIQLTLWLLQNPEPIHTVSVRFNVAQSTVVRITKKICEYIIKYLYSEYVIWPSGAEYDKVKLKFHELSGLPNIIGVIDANHIQVKAHLDDPKHFKNRKGQHSIILQAVCREDMRFTDIYCNSPGRQHDAQVLMESPLYRNGPQWCGMAHLVGDSLYPLLPWLLTPYHDNGYLGHPHIQFNHALANTQTVMQKSFAALKGRFRRLKFVDMKEVGDISKLVLAACILHNMCIVNGDDPSDFIEDVSYEESMGEWQNVIENDLNAMYKRDQLSNSLTNDYAALAHQSYTINPYLNFCNKM